MEGGIKFRLGGRGPGEKFIVRPVTDDGLCGYDEFGQFAVTTLLPDGAESSTHIADVRDDTCVMCDRGWEPTGPSMSDQMRWQVSDSFVHVSCFVRHGALCQRELFWSSLVGAHVRFHGLTVRKNGYWSHSDPWTKQPWYEAELMDHPAKWVFGRRKRVYHVEVQPQGGTLLGWHEEARKVFEVENVTKKISPGTVMLHAWSDEDLRRYVKKISEIAGYVARS